MNPEQNNLDNQIHQKPRKTFSYYFLAFRDFLHSIAAQTYPCIERDPTTGKKIILARAYNYRAQLCQVEFGGIEDLRCTRIFLWHEFLHLWGSVLFWALAVMLKAYVLPFPYFLILPMLVIMYFLIQELYVDRVRYHQRWIRSLIDILVWGVPSVAFIVISLVSL